ncbi:MAG: substrate-binding domain-containing protein [Pirellulaceae bacterium]
MIRLIANLGTATALTLWLVVGLAGCNSSSQNSENGGDSDTPKIGVSLLTLKNPFFDVIGNNIASEAEKHGYQAIVQSAEEDIQIQGNHVKDFIVQGVSAIVLSPCESEAIGPIIKEANDAGIPVFTVDIPCRLPDVKIACQIASDNFQGGKEAAKAMIEALGEDGGKVGILHFVQAESCQLRVKGFREVIQQHNASAAAKIEIAAELEGGGDRDRGNAAAQDLLQAHPDLAGIFCINDPSALGAYAALEKANLQDQVVLIGFDGQPEGKQAIKDGKIYADPVQFPDQMGVQIVDAIIKHSKGEELPAEILIPCELYRQEDAQNDPSLR